MYTEEVLTGSNSLGHFVWVAHLFWSMILRMLLLAACWTKLTALLGFLIEQE
jgi:hypothetical protein